MSTNNTLLIDCGNTFIKWCTLDGKNLSDQQNLAHRDVSVLEVYKNLLKSQASICNTVVMVSVLGEVFSADANKIAEDNGMTFIEAKSEDAQFKTKNAYKQQPENLGNDRLVAMLGACELVDDTEACIVIDSGTATTIDAVDENGQHLGGVIFPGYGLSLSSLSSNTEQLPNLDAKETAIKHDGLATSTAEAITSGCLLSLASSIDGICNKMQRQLKKNSSQPSLKIKRILCGGGAKGLLDHLENDYEYHENLMMIGLKKIQEDASSND